MFKQGNTWHYVTICQKIGYQFKNKLLLLEALTRNSSKNEGGQETYVPNFQRLEFLGDRVIDLVISDILFEQNPQWSEGRLTQAKIECVNNSGPLVAVAHHLGLEEFIISGSGERYFIAHGHEKMLSDHVEALFGAIFIDCGKDYSIVKKLVQNHWGAVGLLNNEDVQSASDATLELLGGFDKEKVRLLVNEYCEREAEKMAVLKSGYDPLDEALLNAIEFYTPLNVEVESHVQLLLQAGANPNSIKKCFEEFWLGDEPCVGDQYTRSALQLAVCASEPSLKIIDLLLDYGADPNWNSTDLRSYKGPSVITDLNFDRYKSSCLQTKFTALHLIAKRHCCDDDNYDLAFQVVKLPKIRHQI